MIYQVKVIDSKYNWAPIEFIIRFLIANRNNDVSRCGESVVKGACTIKAHDTALTAAGSTSAGTTNHAEAIDSIYVVLKNLKTPETLFQFISISFINFFG